MSDHNGPPEKEVGPSASQGAKANRNSTEPTTTDTESNCPTDKCGYGVPCVCWFYADWVALSSPTVEPASVQLQRRRRASYRCARLESGHRDPISASIW